MRMKIIILWFILLIISSCTVPRSVRKSPYNTDYIVRTEQVKAYRKSHKQQKVNKKFHKKNNKRIKKLQNRHW